MGSNPTSSASSGIRADDSSKATRLAASSDAGLPAGSEPADKRFNDELTQMNGATGVTAGAGKVTLIIDPQTATDEALRYTLAHEYHHHWWTSQQATLAGGFTLLEYLLFEGRADAFAQLQPPEYIAPWTDQLTIEQIDEQWSDIQLQLASRDPLLLQSVMFGGGPLPQWTGYAMGNAIIRSFIDANPSSTIEEWTLMEASGFLATATLGAS